MKGRDDISFGDRTECVKADPRNLRRSDNGPESKRCSSVTSGGMRKTLSVAFTGVQGRFVQLRVGEVGADCAVVSSRDVRFSKMTDKPYVMVDGEFKLGIVADWLDARGNRRPYLMVSNLQ